MFMCTSRFRFEDIESTWNECRMSSQRFTAAIILAKLTYGASAWIGFTRASDKDGIESFIRRCKRSAGTLFSRYCYACTELCNTVGERLFAHVNSAHTLYQLVPPISLQACNRVFD